MQHEGYKIRDQQGVYFITFATVQWVDVFSRSCYVDTVLDSMRFCMANKGLRLHAWCVMTNHVHLILSAENGNLSDVIRDFKKFTSSAILKQIENNAEESRRGWMLWIFKQAGNNNSHNDKYQFWQQDNHPLLLESVPFTLSKLGYVHNNPVTAGWVEKPEDYLLSSAKDYKSGKGWLPIEHLTAAYTLKRER